MILFPWKNKHDRVMGGFEYLHADNVTADPGAGGVTFRSDDVGSGVQVPFAKLMDGRDGATGVIPGDATNGLFVNVTTSVLPTGAASSSAQGTANTALAAIQTSVEILDNAIAGSEMQVDIVTSALPSGASTAAKQPALGTAGTASADVITVQGITSMTPLLVNGSGVNQPVTDAGGSLTTDSAQLPGTLGQKAMTASLAVVLASDQASIPVTVATIPSHAVTNAGTFVTQVDGAALTALQLIDDVVFAEDTAAQAADKGIQILAVRRDANTTLVGADNDYAPLQVNADGSLKVAITAGAGSGGTSATDDAAFTVGSGTGTPIMGFADESGPDAVDEGDVGVVRMTLQRGLHVNLRDASGAEVSVGGGTQYDEDTAHTTGDKVTMAGVVRRDANTSLVDTDGDIAALQVNAGGQLKVDGSAVTQPVSLASVPSHAVTNAGTFAVQNTAATPAGTNNIGDVDVLTVPTDPFGANADAASATGSISAKLRFIAGTGIPVTGTVTVGSHAVTNAGTFVTQVDGAALTALQLIDDAVFAEDTAAQAADKGIQILAVRRDADTSLVGADNDYAPLQVNAAGSLKVAITAGAGSGGTSIADDAVFTPATTSITPVGGTYRSTLDTVDDGDAGAFAMTANRAIHVNLRTAAGVELAAGDQYAEDVASAGAENLTLAGAIRRDAAAVGSGADGDYSTINVNNVGRLWTTTVVDTALPAGTNNIGDVDVLTLPNVTLAAGTNTNEVVGDAAHDAAIAGNPVRIAARGMSADYTAVTTGDTADILSSLLGKLVTLPYTIPANTWVYAAPAGGLVSQTAVTVKSAAGSGIRNYVTSVQIINSHQTISTEIMILDGAAGTVLWRGWAQAAGGGISCKFDPPLRGTADTLLEVDEVTATGTAGLLINLQGFVAAE